MGLKAISRLVRGSADYEEGSWTPTIAGQTIAGTQTYLTQLGVYTRFGNMVVAHFNCVMTAKDAATNGNILIAGLPFESADGAGFAGALNIVSNVYLEAGYSQFTIRTRPNGNTSGIVGMLGDNVGSTNVNHTHIAADTTITGVLIYPTDQ